MVSSSGMWWIWGSVNSQGPRAQLYRGRSTSTFSAEAKRRIFLATRDPNAPFLFCGLDSSQLQRVSIEHANPHLCIWQLSLGLSSVKRCETPCGSESNLSLVLPDLTIFTQTLFSSMILRSNINWPLAVINRGMDNRNRAHQTTC